MKMVSVLTHLSLVSGPAYHIAKQSLHTAKPETLDCRDREVGVITEFLQRHLQAMSAGSLYISGAPGTGKTASLLHIIDGLKVSHHGHHLVKNGRTDNPFFGFNKVRVH